MTLVQNHLLRLSGNKNIICILFVAILMVACGGTDKAVSKKRNNTKRTNTTKVTQTKKKQRKTAEVEWAEGTDRTKPPIKNREKATQPGSEKKATYNITYVIPLNASGFTSNSDDRFLQYYAGMEVAKSRLENEGINLNINVVDEKTSTADRILAANVNSHTDAIVGFYEKENIKKAAQYAKDNEVAYVSPWLALSKVTNENPYYVQLKPSLSNFYGEVIKHIDQEYGVANAHIIGRPTSNNDQKRIKYVNRMAKSLLQDKDIEFATVDVLQDSLDMGVTAFDSTLFMESPVVLYIPNWSPRDEAFIYGCLRKLTVEKRNAEVIVYGMPIMMQSPKITFDHYSSLNIRVARSEFVDEADYDVQRFKRDFLNNYGVIPDDDAFEGYDHLMYVGRSLDKHGDNFQFHLEDNSGYYLQSAYEVRKKLKSDGLDDSFEDIEHFENSHVDIIEFKNARFTRPDK